MTELICADRGIEWVSRLAIGPAGDVGQLVEVDLPTLSSEISIGDNLVVKLLSGQEASVLVGALAAVKTGKRRVLTLVGHDELYALSRLAPAREQIFVTMSKAEYTEYVRNTRNLTPKFDIHIQIGDQFGRRGWSSQEVARRLAKLAGLDDLVAAVVPHWVRQVVCRPEVSFVEAILSLFRVQRPVLWVKDGVLFVMDTSLVGNFADNAPTVSNGLLAERVAASPALPEGACLELRGGLGKFRPDKFDGKTWTSAFNLGSALAKSEIEVRSDVLRSLLSGCQCYGGYEFDERVERGESEIHVVKELWLKDVIGNRQRQLFSQERVYRTSPCINWSDTCAGCNLGIRCNGRGTAVSCGWYQPRPSGDAEHGQMVRCEETLHIYELTSWDIETPRELASHTVISGKAWVRSPGSDSDEDGSLVCVWLDPIEYQIRSFSYDADLGTLMEQVTEKRAAVFSDRAECDFWLAQRSPGSPRGGGCMLGQDVCKHFDGSAGRCRLGLACDEFGRLATCPEYTGSRRSCPGRIGPNGKTCHYAVGCADCTLRWRKLADAKLPTDIPSDSVIRSRLIGQGGSAPDYDGKAAPDGVDPECIVDQEIVRYEQVDANTYRRTTHLLRLVGGTLRSSTESHNLPASSVPSHPITLRKMRVFSQVGQTDGNTTPEPRLKRSDANLVDWDDADRVAVRAYENVSKAGVEDTYEVPGELLVPAGTPLLAPAECGSELPARPSVSGVVKECHVVSSSQPDGKGLSTTRLKVRF